MKGLAALALIAVLSLAGTAASHHKRGHQYDAAQEFRELDCGKMYDAIISIRRQIRMHESKIGRHKGTNGFLVRRLKEKLLMLENLYPWVCEEV